MINLSSLNVSILTMIQELSFLKEESEQATSGFRLRLFFSYINKFFPQTLSLPLYLTLVYSLQFLFIFLTLSPPKTKFRYYLLYFIVLIYVLLPLNYGYRHSCTIQGVVPLVVITYSWKMLIWLKKCRYSSAKEDKIIKPFYYSLFWWRNPSITVTNQEEKIINHPNQKGVSSTSQESILGPQKTPLKDDLSPVSKDISIQSPNQNNVPIMPSRYILTRLISFIKFTLIQDVWLIFSEYYMPSEIPSLPYPIRVFQYFTSSSVQPLFPTPFYVFYCVIYNGIIFWNMIWLYEIYLFVASCLLYYIQSTKNTTSISSSKISLYYNKLLIKLEIPQNYLSLVEQWLHNLLFNTPPLFDSPHLSCSPSDFWSKRWQLLYRNCFVELGYLPCKRFINRCYPSSLPLKKELSHVAGTLAGFWWSALFHEYIVQGLFGSANGEQFTFFMFHGIVAIVWEIIVTLLFNKNTKIKKEGNIYYIKRNIGFILWNLILVLTSPWFAEAYIRAKHCYCYPHFGCDYRERGHIVIKF